MIHAEVARQRCREALNRSVNQIVADLSEVFEELIEEGYEAGADGIHIHFEPCCQKSQGAHLRIAMPHLKDVCEKNGYEVYYKEDTYGLTIKWNHGGTFIYEGHDTSKQLPLKCGHVHTVTFATS